MNSSWLHTSTPPASTSAACRRTSYSAATTAKRDALPKPLLPLRSHPNSNIRQNEGRKDGHQRNPLWHNRLVRGRADRARRRKGRCVLENPAVRKHTSPNGRIFARLFGSDNPVLAGLRGGPLTRNRRRSATAPMDGRGRLQLRKGRRTSPSLRRNLRRAGRPRLPALSRSTSGLPPQRRAGPRPGGCRFSRGQAAP
jgi:hypothetical protein